MKTIKKIAVLTIIVLFISITKSFANFSCSMNLTSSATDNKIKAGDTVTITATINNIELSEGSVGIWGGNGFIDYDTDVFETLTKDDIEPGDNMGKSYNANKKKLAIETNDEDGIFSANGTTMFTITLKVKADANFESTTVTIRDFELSDNIDNYTVAKSITFTKDTPAVEPTEEPTEQPSEAPTEQPTEQPTEEPTEQPSEAPTEEPSSEPTQIIPPSEVPETKLPTKAPTTSSARPTIIPQTGIGSSVIFALIGAAAAISVYVGFKMFKSDI